MHDVSFAAHPEWYRWREGLRRRWLARLAARQARARGHDLRVFPRRDRAAPGHHRRSSARDPSWRRSLRCARPQPRRASLWCSSWGRSSTAATCPPCVDGFSRLARRRPDVRLEIVGANRTYPHVDLRALAEAAAPGRIRIRDWVDDAELAVAVRAIVRVCIPVGVRGLRPDAARSARCRHSAGCARHRRGARGPGRRRALRRRRRRPAGRRRAERRDRSRHRTSACAARGARRARAIRLAPHGRRDAGRARGGGQRHDPPGDCHRVVQCARGPGAHAREPHGRPAVNVARGCRGRQRLDRRRARTRARALPRRAGHRRRRRTSDSRVPTTSASRPRQASSCCCSIRTRSCPPGDRRPGGRIARRRRT